MNQRTYPRYFTRVGGFTSDALYVRFDSAEADAVVVTPTGERQSNHGFWPLENCLVMVDVGHARELSTDEARAIHPNGVGEVPRG